MLIVRGSRVLLPDGMRPAALVVRAGRIDAIEPVDAPIAGVPILDAGDLVVLPGLVDTHVHINEPGRTEWEGFETATRAAAAGGVTTLVDMPLNSVPATTSVSALEAKRRAADGRIHVDVGFWGGVVPGNTAALEPLARAGVLGFKCFMSPSGVDEFPHVDDADLRDAAPALERIGVPLLVHAESPAQLLAAARDADPRDYAAWLATRPPEAERVAIERLSAIARGSALRLHIVHVASIEAVVAILEARAAGVRITAETCPHYLTFCAEDIPHGMTALKCAPPIRSREQRERLWQALVDRDLDIVTTDHSSAPAGLKHIDDGDFLAAWGGIASLQLSLPVMWTEAVRRGIALEQLVRWMAAGPAALAGLATKGAIAPGRDADLVFFDPDAEWTVDPQALYHRHPVTPYAGMRLRGRVVKTLLRGTIIFDEHGFHGSPSGQILDRRSYC